MIKRNPLCIKISKEWYQKKRGEIIGTDTYFIDIISVKTHNLYIPRIDCLMSNHAHFMAVS